MIRYLGHWRLLAAFSVFALVIAGCVGVPDPGNGNDNGNQNANDNGNSNDNVNMNSGITGKFIGSTRCMICHENTHNEWSNTLHARALESLEAIGQDENPDCLVCHTVGFGEDGGYVDRATTLDLANVGCESCHGPAANHASNPSDASLRPPVDISSDVCGACHTDSHHPNFEDWQMSGHAGVLGFIADDISMGGSDTTRCGGCHSGDVFYLQNIANESVSDDQFMGVAPEDLNGTTCAICHDPHARTSNAPTPEDGRDFQLRFPEVASPVPTNTIAAATDSDRFNVCGQCHHSRGRTWESTSRGPHHSVQSNVYAGEMPVPVDANEEPQLLVQSRTSVHSFAVEQCATCHLYRQDFQDEQAPAISGHTFTVNNAGCATSGCHPSVDAAVAAQATLMGEVESRLADILARLGDPATWEYEAGGGPEDQSTVSDDIKKARFLYYYALEDGSGGIHNPDYVRDILTAAEQLLTDAGL